MVEAGGIVTTIEDRTDELAEWYAEDELDGAQVLDELREALTKYVVFANAHAAAAVTLWVATTHAVPAFEFAPRLVLTSPEKRCAKSRTLDVVAGTCHRPLVSINATVAAIYRSLDAEHPPTLIIDEADAIFGSKRAAENNEDLRALLNAGHQRGRPALRCVGPQQMPTAFNTFAMAAIAGIGSMPDTITDRAVNVTMRRRKHGEHVAQFRSRRDGPVLARVRDRLALWATEHIAALGQAEPTMPVDDRAADTWEPLIAVADAAGGHWPDTARAACVALVTDAAAADEDRQLSTKLLTDIRDLFAEKHVPFIPSMELIRELRAIEESPWADEDLSPRKLAQWLKDFGVTSSRNAAGTVRGYRLHDLDDVFTRYLCQQPSERQEQPVSSGNEPDSEIGPDTSLRQKPDTDTSPRPANMTCQEEISSSKHVSDATDGFEQTPATKPLCRYCGEVLPAHMRSQIARGYCSRTTCNAAARREAQ